MPMLVQALIKGFGWKLGFEAGRYVARRFGLVDDTPAQPAKEDLEDGELNGGDAPGGPAEGSA